MKLIQISLQPIKIVCIANILLYKRKRIVKIKNKGWNYIDENNNFLIKENNKPIFFHTIYDFKKYDAPFCNSILLSYAALVVSNIAEFNPACL
jgi:hypothetical protein